MHLGQAQRIVVVVAFGVVCLATGSWVATVYGQASYPLTGWTGYAPLVSHRAGLSPTGMLLVWVGIAAFWGTVSAFLLHSPRRASTEIAPGGGQSEP
jgi:heme/copper-type cytochrome/quinol oxidase subunit 1